MKVKNTILLAVISLASILSSCSMSKRASSAPHRDQGRLLAEQQLNPVVHPSHDNGIIKNSDAEQYIPVSSESDQVAKPNDKLVVPEAAAPKIHRHIRAFDRLASFAPRTLLPKNLTMFGQLVKKSSPVASYPSGKMTLPDWNYLLLWIVFLVAAVLLFFLENVVGATTILGVLFSILGVLVFVAFIACFLIWLVMLVKRKQASH